MRAGDPVPRAAPRRARGYTYLGVLLLVAVTGYAAAALGTLWQTARQREKERELLAIGAEFRRAIGEYVRAPGSARPQFPRRLDDLVLDPRQPGVRRHLRRVYVDPMTGGPDWGLVRAPDGGIAGVHSLSEGRPLKTDRFAEAERDFKGATSYADWRFVHREPTLAQPPLGWRPAPAH